NSLHREIGNHLIGPGRRREGLIKRLAGRCGTAGDDMRELTAVAGKRSLERIIVARRDCVLIFRKQSLPGFAEEFIRVMQIIECAYPAWKIVTVFGRGDERAAPGVPPVGTGGQPSAEK